MADWKNKYSNMIYKMMMENQSGETFAMKKNCYLIKYMYTAISIKWYNTIMLICQHLVDSLSSWIYTVNIFWNAKI